MQRSILVEFLKEKLPSNLMQYNKIVSKINSTTENIELTFEDQSSARCDYLVVSDGIFSSTKSLILNKDIKPKYFKSIAIRGTINKEDLNSIDCSNISLFLGSNFHSVIYPVNKDNTLNFIGILRKNLSEDQLEDYSLFDDKNFLSSILSNLSNQIDQNLKLVKPLKKIVVSYEPVWSIGTGVIPKASDLEKNVNFIRNNLLKKFRLKNPKILYGGSVNPKNVKNFKEINIINGFLVGAASQNPKKFIDIVKKTFN